MVRFLDPEIVKRLQFLDPEIALQEMQKRMSIISGSRNRKNGAITISKSQLQV